jgi:putative heme-binding domain-containing protein
MVLSFEVAGLNTKSRLLAALLLVGLSWACWGQAPAWGIEPWADAHLPVTERLELWLDASRPTGLAMEPADGAAIAQWSDASGHGRHLMQADQETQPMLTTAGDWQAVRFDGKQQHLTLQGAHDRFEELTLFVVGTAWSNRGTFRAWLGFGAAGQNDYTTGLNLDLGPFHTNNLGWVNSEGVGFSGVDQLLARPRAFGEVAVMSLTVGSGPQGVTLHVDGELQKSRARTAGPMRWENLVVGGRYFNNGGTAAPVAFLDGDIAQVLVYSRVLTDDQRGAVERYLLSRYEGAKPVRPVRHVDGKPLVAVTDPPPVQMFFPGFEVRRLPLELNNINNLRYRADGKLVALGYDGNVQILSDTDGDGLEDRAELFWQNDGQLRGPIGCALTPPGYKHGQGLFVASKGRITLIADTDGDDRADQTRIVAEGWQEITQSVDALGVAIDPRDESLYFGLGTIDFTNAYLLDKSGNAHYDLTAANGTIQRVSPDFSRRETVCTGIRFPVGLAFNAAGDLFCTDQEGATWLPNGNPYDELLHIEPQRHYGFPPRHPKHLNNVVDEPSLFDYRPQHQSTCGLTFNEPVNGGSSFGPGPWRHAALVCGYSRGKIYRTDLVRSPVGYVARTELIASLPNLCVESCVTPAGALVIATHSGGPDWGSGPLGKGYLYQVRYVDLKAPQPVLTRVERPGELRVTFDGPLDPAWLAAHRTKISVEYGQAVAAGDRFEQLRPGYQVVQDQLELIRRELPLEAVQLTPDGKTLILVAKESTPDTPTYFAITLPRPSVDSAEGVLPQHDTIDLSCDQSGVEAMWNSADGSQPQSIWLPHVDTTVARGFTQTSDAHQAWWQAATQAGTLRMNARMDVRDLFRPAVQPGATLDQRLGPEVVTLSFEGNAPFALQVDDRSISSQMDGKRHRAEVAMPSDANKTPLVSVALESGKDCEFHVSWHTAEDARPRASPLARVWLPWIKVPDASENVSPERTLPAELAGGNWSRGRKVFFGEQAQCSKCHTVRGEGGTLAPDLSNLPFRDYQSVLRDIRQPNYAINPDFLSHIAILDDGRTLTGTVRAEDDDLLITDTKATTTRVARAEIETLTPAKQSIMPEGIADQLGPERLRDLLTFLLTSPPRMPQYAELPPPALRTRAEVVQLLAGAEAVSETPRPLSILLVAGPKDHGLGEHDYPAWQSVWRRLLGCAEGVTIETAWDWPSPEQLQRADAVVVFQRGDWNAARAADVDRSLARGTGWSFLHWAVEGGRQAADFARRIGLAGGPGTKFRHGPLTLDFSAASKHPIARNLSQVDFYDESYWDLKGDAKGLQLLATGVEQEQPRPLIWTMDHEPGRVFVSILGHYSWSFDDPVFRALVLRGMAWSAGEPVDRFNELVTFGARMEAPEVAR